MKFTMSQDGVPRANINVVFRISKEEMIQALAVEAEIWYSEMPEDVGVRELMNRIKGALKYYAEDDLWGREPDEEYREWATRQVERIIK
jgi:hypothetical protein